MAKLYKMEMYIIDVNDNFKKLDRIIYNANAFSSCSFVPFNAQEVKINWHDNIDINLTNCPVDNFREYFKVEEKLGKCTYTEGEYINYECELLRNNKCYIGNKDNFYLGEDNYWRFNGEWCCNYYNPECGCCRPREE